MNSRPLVRFIVLGTQRSGTVFVQEVLNSHSDVLCLGEVLLGMDGPDAVGFPAFLGTRRRARHVWQYVLSGSAMRPSRVIENAFGAAQCYAGGFRVMYNQLSRRVTRQLSNSSVRVIHVVRANTLRQFISLQQMRARQHRLGPGTAHSRSGSPFEAVSVEPSAAMRFVVSREAKRMTIEDLFGSQIALEVSYERDILGRGDTGLVGSVGSGSSSESLDQRLAAALGVRYQQLGSGLKRTGSASLADAVVNFADVAGAFSRSKYSWMLND